MINDPKIEVICDKCGNFIEIDPDYKYEDYSGNTGYYDCSDKAVEAMLDKEGWIVANGYHFCCEECQKDPH